MACVMIEVSDCLIRGARSNVAMSEAAVLEALRCACSQEPAVLKAGEEQLRAWESEPGYYASLAVRTMRQLFNKRYH